MPARSVRKWVWKLIRISIVVVLIVGIIDLVLIVAHQGVRMLWAGEVFFQPISQFAKPKLLPSASAQPFGPFDSLLTNPLVRDKPVLKETLVLDVSPKQIYAQYDVYLPKDHPLFAIVQSSYGSSEADKLVTDVLGSVSLNETRLKFPPTVTSIDENDQTAHFFATSEPITPTYENYTLRVDYPYKPFNLRIEQREVIIRTAQAEVTTVGENLPYSKTAQVTLFKRPQTPSIFMAHVYLPNGNQPAASEPAPESSPTPTLAAVLEKHFNPPGLGTILYSLLGALPYLLLLYWVHKYRSFKKHPAVNCRVEVIQLFLVLHFGADFLFAINDLFYRWGNPVVLVLKQWQRRIIEVFNAGPREHDFLIPIMALLVGVWPAMVRRQEQPIRRHRSDTRWREFAAKALLAVVVIGLIFLSVTGTYKWIHLGVESLTGVDYYGLMLSTLFLSLTLAVVWFVQESFDRRKSSATLTILTVIFILIVLELWPRYLVTFHDRAYVHYLERGVSVIAFIFMSIVVVATFGRLAFRIVTGQTVWEQWRLWSRSRRALVLAGILLVAVSTRIWPPTFAQLISLMFELKITILLGVVWVLVQFLKHKSQRSNWLRLPRSSRRAGILLALFLFYSSTTRWNYIPVEFLVGFLLLEKWLLPIKHFDKSLFSEIKGKLPEIIKNIIIYNDAEKTQSALKKELLGKVASGDFTHAQYLQKANAHNKVVARLKRELTIQNRFAKEVVLAFGPTDSAWENGTKAALYALGFAAPWTILFLRNTIRAPISEESYLLLDVIGSVVLFLLPWVSYGFIFGYFYPYIKGSNGIQKGLSLFVTIVVPTLTWTVLARPVDASNWSSLGIWGLQIFVHTMLLGLVAGDYETVHKAGFRWTHLLEIHRMGALSAWASTVVLAIGGAIAGLISTNTAQLIVSVFKLTAENVQGPTGK